MFRASLAHAARDRPVRIWPAGLRRLEGGEDLLRHPRGDLDELRALEVLSHDP
ncbi:MAG: hypothetical protein HY720_28830 [Planctomycetes bacterium]|nr:hypothetical protein [Planctomycetota bacterium]